MVVESVEKAAAESIEKDSFSRGEVIKVRQRIGAAGSGASANHVGDVSQRDCFRSGDRSDDGGGKTMARKGKRFDIECKK